MSASPQTGPGGPRVDGARADRARVDLPRIVVAAPASGHGKTTLATGLIAALTARGLSVSPHKVGPDYIDPSYHALAAGRPGRNLDPWLVGEDRIVPLTLHGAATPHPADIAVIEGVMGLHDGAAARGDFASTAHVARLLDAPVLLVADARAQGRSIAALAQGMRDFDPAVRVAGVILNRVGSPRHEHLLREALAEIGMPVLGAVGRCESVGTPSRHLGLIPAAERSDEATATVAALADLVTSCVDLDAAIALARSAPALPGPAWDPHAEIARLGGPADPVRVAVAAGPAFTFGYAETVELLAAAGAEVVTVDPLRDPDLPAGTGAVVIGGGFPEEYAQSLSANTGLRDALARFDGPVYAECAGLLYLCHTLDGLPMCGRVPATARMGPRLTLGYRQAVALADSVVARAGETVRGHEFHRTVTEGLDGGDHPAAWGWTRDLGEEPHPVQDGFVAGPVHASYLHVHWAGHPEQALRLVRAAQRATAAATPVGPTSVGPTSVGPSPVGSSPGHPIAVPSPEERP